jgi:hypothetical protein
MIVSFSINFYFLQFSIVSSPSPSSETNASVAASSSGSSSSPTLAPADVPAPAPNCGLSPGQATYEEKWDGGNKGWLRLI